MSNKNKRSLVTNGKLVESNDNTRVQYNHTPIKRINSHLPKPKPHEFGIEDALGAIPLGVAALPFIGAAATNLPTIAGASIWSNPLTQQMLASSIGGLGIDIASKTLTDKTWGENMNEAILNDTGYDMSNSAWTSWIPYMTNPGNFLSYNAASKIPETVSKNIDNTINNIADKYFFVERPNSFTRGIGDVKGLEDLMESGFIRGNPAGSEVSANHFAKMYRRNRHHFREIVEDTGIKDIQNHWFNRSLSKKEFDALKSSAEKIKTKYPSKYPSKPNNHKGFDFGEDVDLDPLSDYNTYDDYLREIKFDKANLNHIENFTKNNQPIAYFYDDGRNPIIAGHDYAKSTYGVRVNNVHEYNPKIYRGHLHYSLSQAPALADDNVELFKKGLFGLTPKLDKATGKRKYLLDIRNILKNK